MRLLERLEKDFIQIYDKEHEGMYFSPGRMNLIGEHIDYHGGYVLPATISMGTYALVSKRSDKKIRMYSANFPDEGIFEFSLPVGKFDKKASWTNYPKGVMWVIENQYHPMPFGFDIYYYGNIPNGAGLSSSASLQLLTAWVLKDLFGYDFDRVEAALMSQKSENEYVGVQCGIMDQFAVAMGKEHQAILLNTNSLQYEYAPIALENARFVIMNSNKQRGLEDSAYNTRREESEKAFHIARKHYPKIAYLTDLKLTELEAVKDSFEDELIYRRAKHVVSENERTLASLRALEANDLKTFGELLNASHASLKEDYEVTGQELDTLAETAQSIDGVYGARMTGAGFGGCAIALVHEDSVDSMIETVSRKYHQKMMYDADFYIADIVDGVHKID